MKKSTLIFVLIWVIVSMICGIALIAMHEFGSFYYYCGVGLLGHDLGLIIFFIKDYRN